MQQVSVTSDVFHFLIDSLPVGVFVKDAEDHFRYVMTNRVMKELSMGVALDGHVDEDLFSANLVAKLRKQDEETLCISELTQQTVYLNGHLHHTLKRAFRSADGHRFLVGTVLDVTEVERSHKEAQDARLLLETLLANLPLGVAVKDADNDYRVVKCNTAFEQIVQRTSIEIEGHTIAELNFTDLDESTLNAQDRKVMDTGKPIEFKEKSPRKNAPPKTFHVTKFPLRLQDGRNLLIGTFSDITDVQNLYEGERIINAVLSQILKERDITKIFENVLLILREEKACDAIAMFSYSARDNCYQREVETFVNGKHSADFIQEKELQSFLARHHPSLLLGKQILVADCESSLSSEMWHKLDMKSVIGTPVFLDKAYWGCILFGFLKSSRAFSETDQRILDAIAKLTSLYLIRKHEEQVIQQATRMEALAMLAGGVAHDFNNILQVILGNTDLVLMDLPKDSPYRENLQEVSKAAEGAKGITGELLSFARKQAMEKKLGDLNLIIQDLLPICKRLAGKKVELHYTASTQPCWAFIDRAQVSQILINLVVNARDAIVSAERENGKIDLVLGKVALEISSAPMRAFAHLAITDNGCGIAENIKAHIFDPLFTTKPEGKGTGLGLPTVRDIVEQNGGTISVESVPGKSTTFTILIPLTEERKDRKDKCEEGWNGFQDIGRSHPVEILHERLGQAAALCNPV